MSGRIKILLFLFIGIIVFSAVDAHKLVKKFRSEEIENVEVDIEEREPEINKKKGFHIQSLNTWFATFLKKHLFSASSYRIGEYFSPAFNYLYTPKRFLLFHQFRFYS